MRVGIVGNYGNNNQGDEAVLEGILIQLEEILHVKREEIVIFSNQPEQTAEKYGVKSVKLYYKNKSAPMTMLTTIRKNQSLVRKLDLLLVGGGGIFMDLYGREAYLFGMYGWLAKLSGTPVVLYGVGAGPILTRTGKIILRSLAHLAKLVTVRDPKSKKLLESIGVKSPIHVIGDPAFRVRKPEHVTHGEKGLNIGVTAVPFHHGSYWPEEDMAKYDNYITGMARNLDKLLSEYPDARINFFATKHPQDSEVVGEIKGMMNSGERCTIQEVSLNHQEIVSFSGKQDIIIGTRLHSLILALITGTPIVAVSYHHKVQDFMSMIACDEYNIPIDRLNDDDEYFFRACKSMDMNWPDTLERFATVSAEMKQKSSKGMHLIRQTFQQDRGKILVLSNMYPSKHSKTFGIFVKNQVDQLREQGLNVDVIGIKDPRKGKLILLKKYLLFFIQGLWNLLIRGREYQAVHVHYIFPTGVLGLFYKLLRRKRLIVTSHGGDIDQMSKKSGIVQKLTRRILEKSDQIIVVGERLKEEIQMNFHIDKAKVSVINMGVDRKIFQPGKKEVLRKNLGIAVKDKVLLFVGNLIPAKGLDDLVEAFDILQSDEKEISLHLIGEPKDQAYYQGLKQRTEQYQSIYIHDALPQEAIAEWMAAADVFVLPSYNEGFGLVALEAMASGLPVVGSDVGGLSYLLADNTGLKTEPHNPEDLANKIRELLGNEEMQNSFIANGYLKADQFDQEKLIQSVISLYGIQKAGE